MSLALLFLLQQIQPKSQWQVPFFPVQQAAINDENKMFFATGSELYLYDFAGELIERRAVETVPEWAFSTQLQQFCLVDRHRLICFDQNLQMVWSRQIEPLIEQPFRFRSRIALPFKRSITLMNPADGQIDRALFLEGGIEKVHTLGSLMLVSGLDGQNRFWDEALTPWHIAAQDRLEASSIVFIERGPDQSIAVAYANRSIQLIRPNWKSMWQRQFVVDVALRPVWLGSAHKPVLAVATHARDVRFYNIKGRELWRVNLSDRPSSMVLMNPHTLAVTHQELSDVVWILPEAQQTHRVKRDTHLTHVLQNQGHVIFIGYDGIISSYEKVLHDSPEVTP
ncbi:MAG: hypothetical protein KDC35_20050 [Acidobacteria bacterium]|nr:hypothetical protein [Acidobacteriota bacterium]